MVHLKIPTWQSSGKYKKHSQLLMRYTCRVSVQRHPAQMGLALNGQYLVNRHCVSIRTRLSFINVHKVTLPGSDSSQIPEFD